MRSANTRVRRIVTEPLPQPCLYYFHRTHTTHTPYLIVTRLQVDALISLVVIPPACCYHSSVMITLLLMKPAQSFITSLVKPVNAVNCCNPTSLSSAGK